MRKAALALLAAGALGLGAFASPVAADPAPASCNGQFVANIDQIFGNRRVAADTFFGDSPQAVREGEITLKALCGIGGG